MTIEEAIKHCTEIIDKHTGIYGCDECAKEHIQLVLWLKELKQLREQE